MSTEQPIQKIEVWSDIACPWCWVGKKHIEAALADFDAEVRVVWRAFELNPQAPATPPYPVDYAEKLAFKYGMSRDQAQAFIDQMTAAGAAQGAEFRFDRIRPSNTFNAHRLLSWAGELGLQNALKERLFLAYMNEGSDVNDTDTLCTLAADVGLNAEEAKEILASGAHSEAVRAEQARAAEMGITGVPFFVFGSGITASGAQPQEVLREALDQACRLDAAQRNQSSTAEIAPGTCGLDGCAE